VQLLGAECLHSVPARVGYCGRMVRVRRVSHRAAAGVAVDVDLDGELAGAAEYAGRCRVGCAMASAHGVKDSSS
jgi:hypothetical protein